MTITQARDTLVEIHALTYIAECLATVQEKGEYHAPAVCLVAEQTHERCKRLDEHCQSLLPSIDTVNSQELRA